MKTDIIYKKTSVKNQPVANMDNSILSQFVAKRESCNNHKISAPAGAKNKEFSHMKMPRGGWRKVFLKVWLMVSIQ